MMFGGGGAGRTVTDDAAEVPDPFTDTGKGICIALINVGEGGRWEPPI